MTKRQQGNANIKRKAELKAVGKCGNPFLSMKRCYTCKNFDECYSKMEGKAAEPKFKDAPPAVPIMVSQEA